MGNNCFAQTFSGGNGSVAFPYRISNTNDLDEIAYYVNLTNWRQNSFSGKYFVMTTNITVNTFTPIGTSNDRNFQGNFDGRGYTLSSVNISSRNYAGIFGYISGATIKNVRIGGGSNISSNVSGYTGALVGYAVNSTIDSCNSTVNPSGNNGCRLGGLIGYANGCTINNCSSTATSSINTSPNGYYGGLVGYADNTTFNRCYSTAGISGSNNSKLGGLLGYITNNCLINECYSTGIININAYGYVGGLVGQSIGSQISKSYSTSSISSSNGSNNRVGGLVGSADNTIISNCYSKASITNMNGIGYVGGLVGDIENGTTISNSYSAPLNFTTGNGTGGALYGYSNSSSNSYINSYYQDSWGNQSNGSSRTPADMKTLQFAIDLNACQTNIWRGFTNNYPVLYWEGTGTDLPSCFDGTGTLNDPIRIKYAIDLIRISNSVAGGSTFSGQYLLVENDISFTTNPSRDSSQYFNPIGNSTNRFSGNFSGGGHKISNLTINSGTYVGLFGYISSATIDSLGIENFTLKSNRFAGGLCAYIESSTIKRCYSLASLTSLNNSDGDYPQIGGLIGCSNNSTIINCYARVSIVHGTTLTYYYNPSYGGLIGQIANVNGSTITNCYSAPISLPSTNSNRRDVGSLLGYCNSGYLSNLNFSNSYYLNIADETSATSNYGTVKDSIEMKSGCFAATLNYGQSPIVWFKAKSQVNQGYPVLSWQKLSNNLSAGFEGNCLGVTYAGGTQTTQYKIRYVKDLIYMSNMVRNDTNYYNKYFQFQNDINYNNGVIDSSSLFNPIGDSNNNCFSGNIDGNGKIISNLIISKNDSVGLFGCISGATIQSLGIANNCSFTSKVYGGSLVAYASNSTIDKCYSKASLTGNAANSKIGGLAGYINTTSINNSYSRTSITNSSIGSSSGGMVCSIDNNSTILNSYSSPVSFPTDGTRGILVGSIANCTNPSLNSYYDSTFNVSSMTILGTSLTLTQMRTLDFAMALNACQTNVWKWANGNNSLNNGLPMLNWEGIGEVLPFCGSSEYPFRIRCVADLITLSNNVAGGITYSDQYLIVENDIDFINDPTGTANDFYPIGNDIYSFQGNFNGKGHIISNLTKHRSNDRMGLFGSTLNARIDSLGIEGFVISTDDYGGGLIGYASNTTINSCFSLATLTGYEDVVRTPEWFWYNYSSDHAWIGGLIGRANSCTINNCYSRSIINNQPNQYYPTYNYNDYYYNYYGGLVGYIDNSTTISNSYSAPYSISNAGNPRGTLVGYKSTNSTATNSYFSNALTGMDLTNFGTAKDSLEMKSGCFVVSLNGSQPSIAWFKAKSQVNLGYPVLSWQKFSDNITPAGFEGNCLVTNDGSPTNPYQVKYVKDLIYISNMVANDTTYNGEYFKVLNDINYNNGVIDSSSLFNPIGVYSNNKPFSGNFNGQRFAIANYSFSDVTKDNVGLFGYIKNSTIQRLGISNFSIKARNNVGGLVGNTDASSTLDTCFVYGFISGVSNVGGLVGNVITAACNINNSFTNTTIDAQTNVGGIAGNFKGAISNSYSNSEIYSSTSANDYVGGIIGYSSNASNLTNVYSVCKIIRNGTNTNFGKIKGNNLGSNTNCYSRDSVFVNYTNSNTTGYNGISKTNAELRNPTFVSTLGSTNWKADYSPDRINDGYPILKYQPQAVKPNSSGLWPTTTASQVVIIKSGVQLKANSTYFPKCAYVKIEAGGELNNTTNINVFGEYNRELYVGKWNLIGLSTYNRILSCLYNYADTAFKTFVKRFDYGTNNWQASTNPNINTVININTAFDYGEGFLVMPNYSLDQSKTIKSRIISKGVLFNDTTLSRGNSNNALGFISLANNYPAGLSASSFVSSNSSNMQNGAQGRLIYVYDADSGKWNNNNQSINPITSIRTCEGFFIVSSGANGNFGFNKGQMNNTSGAKNLIKSDLIYVQAIADSNVRESFLEFNEEADNAFDFEDGLMLFGNNYNSVEPFFTIPTPEINDSTLNLIKDAFSSLPYTTELDLRSQKNNEVTLNFSNIPSNIHVYLLDSLLRHAQYLNEEPDYNLQVSTGDNAKRLYVLFSYYKEDINEFFKPEPGEIIKIWNYNNTLNIEGRDLIRYELFDILGNKLLEQEIQDDKFNTQLDLGSGIYIVRAYSNTSSNVKKISISSK